jgi:hypothetical protein
MPFSPTIEEKLATLRDMRRAGQPIYAGEFVEITFGGTDGIKRYATRPYDILRGFASPSVPEITPKIVADNAMPFLELVQTAAIADDKVTLPLSDLAFEMTTLFARHGEGLQARVFSHYPQVDLQLEEFIGTTKAPKSGGDGKLSIEIASGFRSPNLLLPHRHPAASCQFIWGGHLSSQAEIDAHKGCPWNRHVGGSVGNADDPVTGLPWDDCARDSRATCAAHLITTDFFPGFATVGESIPNNQTKGANLRATAIGNEGTFTDPVRMVYGYKLIKGLRLISYRIEADTNHPDKGWIAFIFEVCEGTIQRLGSPNVNGVYVAPEHLNIRLGSQGQTPSFFSPSAPSFSRTAHFFGRIQGDFRNATASTLSASAFISGQAEVRVYSDPVTYAEEYTEAPAWCVLDMLTRKTCAYGEDFSRYDIQSVIDAAAWHAESVGFHDPNGNLFAGTRSTFNAEVNARATQQQIYDSCVSARMAVPFTFQGKKTFRPLRKETVDDSVPVFTDQGSGANVCADNGRALVSYSYIPDDELVNQVVVNFDDASNWWTQTPLTFGDQIQQLRAGKAQGDTSVRVIPKTYPAFGITNMSEAARLGNLLLYLGPLDGGGIYNNLRFTITAWFMDAIGIRPYDLVKLELRALTALKEANPDRFDFDYFRVIKKVRKGNLRVELTCQAYPVDFYERMEDVLQPPPLIAPGYQPNPGGRPGSVPLPVEIDSLSHTGDRIRVRALPMFA